MHRVISGGFWGQKSSFFNVFAENIEFFFIHKNHILAGRGQPLHNHYIPSIWTSGHQNRPENGCKYDFSTPIRYLRSTPGVLVPSMDVLWAIFGFWSDEKA